MSRTICVSCRYIMQTDETAARWSGYLCTHPVVKRRSVIDPVTGEAGFSMCGDASRIVFTKEPFPVCRDINLNGECSFYETK